jgi:hypothetical protein
MQHLPSPPAGASDMDDQPEIKSLFAKLKRALPEMEAWLEKCSSHSIYEDTIYRFYHQSFKVYQLEKPHRRNCRKTAVVAPRSKTE